MARKVLSDSDVQQIVKAELAASDGHNSALAAARAENMDYYQGAPFGTEIEGRSSVVSSDVRDTIEWILPTLIRIFCSGEDAVEFEPETPNDVEVAKQATEYVNFIWNRDNKGFLNTYSWFKDGLLQKNGTLKIWWDNSPVNKRERYQGLDDTAFSAIVNDKDVEVSEHTENKQTIQVIDPQTGQPADQQITTHDVVVTRKIAGGKVCVVPVPPEEFLISKDARSIEGARLVAHRTLRSLSDLRAKGIKQATLDKITSDETSLNSDQEAIARNTVEDQSVDGGSPVQNDAMRQVWVTEAYIQIDVDGDGIAEMRKVEVAGSGATLLSNEAWDMPRPFADLTPIIMPHRYHGLAVADLIKDIQLIKSTILRQYLDNLYLRNNQREQVIEANIVDPAEVLSSAPGRKIRIKNGPAVFPIEVPDVGAAALEGMNYLDQIKENRTGSSARTQGLGADALHETAAGERMLMSAAMGKIELIARIFAETGVKDAFRLILKLICEYQDKPRTIRLTENWVDMDPKSWNSDMDMTVRVGMSMGDKDQQLQHAMLLGTLQEKALALGAITPDNLHNSSEIAVNAMGFKGTERFFTWKALPQDKAIQPPQPKGAGQQKDPQLEMALKKADVEGRVQAATAVAAITAKAKAATDANLNQMEAQRQALEHQDAMELEKLKSALSVIQAHIENVGKIEVARISAKISDGAAVEAREQAGEAA